MLTKATATFLIVFFFPLAIGCQGQSKTETKNQRTEKTMGEQTMEDIDLKSAAFPDSGNVPEKYTCDGKNVSIPLEWTAGPENTKSWALIADDPDAPAGTWVHWVVFNIPPHIQKLYEGISFKADSSFAGTLEGQNDFRKTSYGGPCPPRGPAHRYFFKIYALDTTLDLTDKATKADLEKAMKGHVLGSGLIIGKYARKQ